MKKILLAGCLFLAACATPEPIPVAAPVHINIQVPASLERNCYIPAPPAREVLISAEDEAQSLVADWALESHGALENCAARQSGLVGVVREYKRTINELNAQSQNP